MDGLFRCVLYLAAIGILFFIVGRVLPKEKFQFSKFPFRSFAVEKEGIIYRKLWVQKWKDKVPDMSRVCPAWISSKKLPRSPSVNQMERMIQETCIAEWVHTRRVPARLSVRMDLERAWRMACIYPLCTGGTFPISSYNGITAPN